MAFIKHADGEFINVLKDDDISLNDEDTRKTMKNAAEELSKKPVEEIKESN